MTEKKYTGYSVEELLQDQEFILTVKRITAPQEWERFLQIHKDSKKNILQAVRIIQLFKPTEGTLSEEKKHKLWKNINHFRNRKNSFRELVKIAASVLIILSAGIPLYRYLNKAETSWQFTQAREDLQAGNPLLLLANGQRVQLEKSNSNLTVLKDQNAIQINNDRIVENQVSAEDPARTKLNEVIIPYGKKTMIVLEDGTKVWLNAGSRMAFPQKFEKTARTVFLEGEAYFEVTRDDHHPFFISTENLTIKVLGTKFNVQAYRSDNFSETILLEGSIRIAGKNKLFNDKVRMEPRQKAIYSKTRNEIVITHDADPELHIAWIEGWYQFKNEALEKVLKKIERYYNLHFEYDQALISGAPPVSGKLDLKESLDEVMIILSKVAKFEYKISGDQIIIVK